MDADQISRLTDNGLDKRITNLEQHLSIEDWKHAMQVLTHESRERSSLPESHLAALNVRLAFEMSSAIKRMDKASRVLAGRLVWMTGALLVFTVVLVVETWKLIPP